MTLACPPDQDIVVIGATGDLARRKLIPALWNLHLQDLLPRSGAIVGFARSALNDEQFRALAREAVETHSRMPVTDAWPGFASRLCYVTGSEEGIAGIAARSHARHRLLYLSVPPSAFASTVRNLGAVGLAHGSRIIVEKPFGHDLASSVALDDAIHAVFDESQVFRIDHYLGKETVQNILVFRFGNSVYERVWNRDAIDHIQFTVAESIGIEGRGAFYEETGALRDILQNHVLQVLALLAMEAPSSWRPEAVRDEKAKLFCAIRPITPDDVVFGQYTRGGENGKTPGYLEEPGVAPGSSTETFAAVRLHIDNWRWAGVPIFLRTGKRLPRRTSEVAVVFREAPVMFFADTPVDRLKPNMLNIAIQPEEGISFQFLAKVPGPEVLVEPVTMQFSYGQAFKVPQAEAYERLLHDAMDGDHTLFAREDTVHRAWEIVEPVLHDLPATHPYPAGTWGPVEANALIAPRLWHPR